MAVSDADLTDAIVRTWRKPTSCPLRSAKASAATLSAPAERHHLLGADPGGP